MLRALFFALLLCGCTSKQLRFTGGSVAADHELASNAGVEILQMGGNAVDAAVATSFTLSVVRPFSCGIGGGGFMLIASPDMEPVALNYRERAPAATHPHFYKTNSSRFGSTAVGVPGTVAGLLAAHRRYGKLPLQDVLAPAIRIANEGFRPDAAYKNAMQSVRKSVEDNPEFKSLEVEMQTVFAVQDNIKLTKQGVALNLIAKKGEAGFYRGDIADAIVSTSGGHITLQDLQDYEPSWVSPLEVQVTDDLELVAMPPPSSGGIAIAQLLMLMESVDAFDLNRENPKYIHFCIESMKHAFANRAEYLADPEFVDVPVDTLLHEDHLQELSAKINPYLTNDTDSYGDSSQLPNDDGTSHLCVVDTNGMVVVATETINTSFGSLVLVEPFDFLLNNEMDDFSSPTGTNIYGLEQSNQNLPQQGKRPLSSMSPTIVLKNGEAILLLGASGGPRIISSVAQVLINNVWYGDDPIDAIARARWHHQWKPDVVYIEEDSQKQLPLKAIESFGHDIRTRSNIGVVQMIEIRDGDMLPASDPRKGGIPAGYHD